MERTVTNFVLNEAKFFGIAVAIAKNFNDVQNKICSLQPTEIKGNKSIIKKLCMILMQSFFIEIASKTILIR